MNKKRIVITGIGIVSPIGIGKDEFWENLFAGKSGIKPITLFDTSNLKVKVAGEITDFDPLVILEVKKIMDLDRATLLLLSAAKLCLEDGQFQIDEKNTYQTGVAVGTTFGSLNSVSKYDQEALTEGPRYANPSVFPSTVGNSPASRISIKHKIKGFNTTISTGISAGLDALEYSADLIELNRAKQILVGSVEDLSLQTFMGLYKLDYLSGLHSTPACSCPFDKNRDGVVFAEGATMFLVQEADLVQDKTKIYGQISGVGSVFDPARFYRYNPKGTGMKRAMKMALDDAGLKPEDIDCVFANANATRGADPIETLAIKEVFGKYSQKVLVTAVKSITGETYSNSGSLAVAAALGAIAENKISPIINYKNKDENCELNFVLDKAKKQKVTHALINTFGPNGKNTSIIISRYN
ncbi:MAG: beta-ketoacyl-[acyl-carrier-protein] synthase family protein [Candidatus Omnitrophica bacterium]|nr:beta-ketoacyl-[acyl-carrier-protein] synthase family protein [Candidatus Omnitrophota bacterium]